MTHATPRVTRRALLLLRTALAACSFAASPASAQEVRILRDPIILRRGDDDPERPMIGVTTAGTSERADTLGLLIQGVTRGSPAERAGLQAGDRLQAVNGLSLRADPADAGEADYAGVLARRLQRAVQATKPGEAVTLRVLSGAAARDVRVTPVRAGDLEQEAPGQRMQEFLNGTGRNRAVLGLTVESTGTVRDTLGVFVQSVVRGGPAEQAGIVEGDRIASINGVSLRVAAADADDPEVGAARAERLVREMEKVRAGEEVELVVVTAGRRRTVRVTAKQASELPEDGAGVMRFTVPAPDLPRRAPGGVREHRDGMPPALTPGQRERIEDALGRLPRLRSLPMRRRVVSAA